MEVKQKQCVQGCEETFFSNRAVESWNRVSQEVNATATGELKNLYDKNTEIRGSAPRM